MFSKILGKRKGNINGNEQDKIITEKVSKMNLSDMRLYVNNNLNDFKICQNGLAEVMKKLVSKDVNNKRFIESDAMDSKIKKAFDLVIVIASNKKITVVVAELIQDFINTYNDIILQYDEDNKEIYASRLKDCLTLSISNLAMMSKANEKFKILGE